MPYHSGQQKSYGNRPTEATEHDICIQLSSCGKNEEGDQLSHKYDGLKSRGP
jgi:hypothetical protein